MFVCSRNSENTRNAFVRGLVLILFLLCIYCVWRVYDESSYFIAAIAATLALGTYQACV